MTLVHLYLGGQAQHSQPLSLGESDVSAQEGSLRCCAHLCVDRDRGTLASFWPLGPQLLTLVKHSAFSRRHLVLLQAFRAEGHLALG